MYRRAVKLLLVNTSGDLQGVYRDVTSIGYVEFSSNLHFAFGLEAVWHVCVHHGVLIKISTHLWIRSSSDSLYVCLSSIWHNTILGNKQ